MSEEREGFLGRWSRKKRQDEESRQNQEKRSSGALPSQEIANSAAPEPEEPAFDISTLPDLETLTETSDALAFLQKGVPDALKNAALRRIWSADASIRDYIGPVEMGWDFNDPNGIPGFGPLAPDTDVASLLRQAIGEVEPVIKAEKDTVSHVALEGNADAVEEPDRADPAPLAVRVHDDVTSSNSENIENSGLQDSEGLELASFRALRRHGGALPKS